MAAPKQPISFTARDTELLTHAFQCLKEKPNIDYDLMALNAGFKGAKSARDSFGRLYDKILSGSEKNISADGETGEVSSKKKKGTPSKRKAGGAGGNEDENGDASSSKKKKKGTLGKAGAGGRKKVAAGDEEDGDTIAAAVKSEAVEQDGEDGVVAGQDV